MERAGRAMDPAPESLRPAPADLAAHRYTAERVVSILWHGSPGTAMPAWRDLPPADLASLADAVRELHAAVPEPVPAAEELARGALLYTANCAQCHGAAGAGDGPAAHELEVPAHDFRGARPSPAESLRVVRDGVEGTRMAPWATRLSERRSDRRRGVCAQSVSGGAMIADIVVLLAGLLAAAFCIGWWLRPAWRAGIERPKHRFQETLRRYDRGGTE